jgi:uncharacterized protein (TIGR02996 family)
MNERQGLLRAIVEYPDDDTHRLVFADWLEEHDQTGWASLIRAQCSLAKLLVQQSEPFQWNDACLLTVLVPELRDQLLAPFHVLTDNSLQELHFRAWVRRGFIEGIEIIGGPAARDFVLSASTIADQVPIRHIRFTRQDYCDGEFRELMSATTLRTLLDQEWVANLETLDLSNLNLGEAGVRCLLRSHYRLNLKRLDFNANNIGEQDAQTLRRLFGSALLCDSLEGYPVIDDIPF